MLAKKIISFLLYILHFDGERSFEEVSLFSLLEATDKANIHLTESFAMQPAASVSGYYFAHPDSAYFGTGRIDRDQVEDYARRKGWRVTEAERWLAPILNYDPAEKAA